MALQAENSYVFTIRKYVVTDFWFALRGVQEQLLPELADFTLYEAETGSYLSYNPGIAADNQQGGFRDTLEVSIMQLPGLPHFASCCFASARLLRQKAPWLVAMPRLRACAIAAWCLA